MRALHAPARAADTPRPAVPSIPPPPPPPKKKARRRAGGPAPSGGTMHGNGVPSVFAPPPSRPSQRPAAGSGGGCRDGEERVCPAQGRPQHLGQLFLATRRADPQ